MPGEDGAQSALFATFDLEARIPARHPLRSVRSAAAPVLAALGPRLRQLYPGGHSPIAPEQVLRAHLVWALMGIPSERQLLEELDYNLLYRWFIGLGVDAPMWSRAAFQAHRRKLVRAGVLAAFTGGTLARLRAAQLAAPQFRANLPLLEAWSGQQALL
jgi:transposase